MSEDLRKNCDLCNSDKNKSCNKDDKDCCCGIDTIRKILKIFQRDNIPISIDTENSDVTGFVFDLTEDVVYISEYADSSPNQIVPLCNISRFLPDTDDFPNEFIEEVSSLILPTSNTNPCCCTDGVANTINDIRRFSDPTNTLILVVPTTSISDTLCVSIDAIIKVNDDVVFFFGNVRPIIVSTCAIDSMSIVANCPV